MCEDQIDWTEGKETLRVDRQLAQDEDKRWILKSPKSAASNRTVPLPIGVVKALRALLDAQPEEAREYTIPRIIGDSEPTDVTVRFVFAKSSGAPTTPATIRDRWGRIGCGGEATGRREDRNPPVAPHLRRKPDRCRCRPLRGVQDARTPLHPGDRDVLCSPAPRDPGHRPQRPQWWRQRDAPPRGGLTPHLPPVGILRGFQHPQPLRRRSTTPGRAHMGFCG
jgi:hypothetical protein